MQALRLHSFGEGAGAVRLTSQPTPTPGAGEVLVAVEAAPINPSDLHLIGGYYGVRPPLPAVLGTEGVGRVLQTGPAVDDALVGRRVVIVPDHGHGTWATHAIVASDHVVVAGEDTDALQLAMAGVNPATALLLLREYAELQPGDWIAQTGANSAVGQYVARLAKSAGINTFNIVRRPDAAEIVTAAGGNVVVLADDDLPAALHSALGDQQLALVLDSVGGPTVTALAHRLRFGGTVVSYGAISGQPLTLDVRADVVYRGISHHGFWLRNWLRQARPAEIEDVYRQIVARVTDGDLTVTVDKTYDLEHHEEALAHARRYRRDGKILLIP